MLLTRAHILRSFIFSIKIVIQVPPAADHHLVTQQLGARYGYFLQLSRIYGALLERSAVPALCKDLQQPLYIGVISVEVRQPTAK
jgi:hypothetical protein